MNRTLLVAAVVLTLAMAAAGCTSNNGADDGPDNTTTQVSASDGLTVSFRSIASTYLEDEEIRLQMDIENTGQSRATDISVGLSGTELIEGDDIVQDPVAALRPADPGSGEPGGSTVAAWATRNGLDLGDGESQPVQVTGTVSYGYRTEASGSFTVVPRSEFDGSTSPVTLDSTAAPVHATVSLQSPRPVYAERSRNLLDVPVTIRNVGDGEVSDLTFAMSLPNVGDQVTLSDCGGTGPDQFPLPVDLFEDGTRRIICTVNLTQLTGNLQFESTVPVSIDLAYTYTEKDQTTFTVQGLPGDRTG